MLAVLATIFMSDKFVVRMGQFFTSYKICGKNKTNEYIHVWISEITLPTRLENCGLRFLKQILCLDGSSKAKN